MEIEKPYINRVQKHVIWAITLGNILEWYDIYLYIFWAPTLSALFFKDNSSYSLFKIILLFALGYICRPLGGIVFGRLGDRIGRRQAFILSILLMTIPTFLLGLIPTYSQLGIYSPLILAFCRILQTFPSGGELPGAFCYLYENADLKNRKFMTSFAGVGNQIGIALSAIECFLLETFLPSNILTEWGWRISFAVGGLIGLGGFFLRYRLHETKLFQELVVHHRMSQDSTLQVIKENWRKIITGISYGAAQTVSFHFISILFPIFFYKNFGISYSRNLIPSIALMILTTLPLPLFGLIGDKFGIKNLLIGACMGMICLLFPLYLSVQDYSVTGILVSMGLYVLCFTCITALWPYLISHLFHTSARYTCLGLSFNIADGVFGGIGTLITFYLVDVVDDFAWFTWALLIACLISLISFFRIDKTKA